MKPLLPLVTLFIGIASVYFASTCRADDPLEYSFYLIDAEDSQWQLVRFADNLVFVSVKPRPRPNDAKRKTDFAGTGIDTIYIEPASGGDRVPLPRIHLLKTLCAGGPYALSMESLKGHPKAYLTADYSTDPPTVRLEKTPGKEGRWTFVDSGKLLQTYLKHEGDPDKPAWLSLADSGSVVPAAEKYGNDMVFEFRAPVLNTEKKHRISISRHTESK